MLLCIYSMEQNWWSEDDDFYAFFCPYAAEVGLESNLRGQAVAKRFTEPAYATGYVQLYVYGLRVAVGEGRPGKETAGIQVRPAGS